MRAARFVLLAALAACGDEEPTTSNAGGQTPAPAGGGGQRAGAGSAAKQIVPQRRIEDNVFCPIDKLTTEKLCDSKLPNCPAGQHCLQASNGWFCGACPERDSIRHTFKPRDFIASADTRDPFQSFVILQPGLSAAEPGIERQVTPVCTRKDQFVAINYSYQDLKLVGIVSRGTQRKVLMMDAGNLGHIIKRGDCVGKEKAVVKDIGAGYITFQVTKEPTAAGTPEAEEHSVPLYPTNINITNQLNSGTGPRTTITPVVAPPPTSPSPMPPTRIEKLPPTLPSTSSQAPTTLKP
jgi:Tfp pilus assembly protein PilP